MLNLIKYTISLSILLAVSGTLQAQKNDDAGIDCFNKTDKAELGFTFGTAYYMGDFNPNLTPFYHSSLFGGAMFRYNFIPYVALRTTLTLGQLKGNTGGKDGFPIDPWRNDWNFYRPMLAVDAIAEFNFMPYDVVDIRKNKRFTPFLMLGVGVSYLFPDSETSYSTPDKRNKSIILFDLPVGIGIKWCIARRFTLGVDWIFKVSFNDLIDFYEGVNESHSPVINNDWIGTFGLSLTYLLKPHRTCPAYNRHTPSSQFLKGGQQVQPKAPKKPKL
jgi:hypothetical protein